MRERAVEYIDLRQTTSYSYFKSLFISCTVSRKECIKLDAGFELVSKALNLSTDLIIIIVSVHKVS